MQRQFLALLTGLALLLAACDAGGSQGETMTTPADESGQVVETVIGTDTPQESQSASPTTETEPSETAQREPGDTILGLGQPVELAIDEDGQLPTDTITATVGLTLEVLLANQGDQDALVLFELAPTGTAGVFVPAAQPDDSESGAGAVGNRTPTPTGAAEVTTTAEVTGTSEVTATSEVTGTAGITGTSELTGTTTATSTATTGTPESTETTATTTTEDLVQKVFYVRYDQPGTYRIFCAPVDEGAEAGCSGTTTIVVADTTGSEQVAPTTDESYPGPGAPPLEPTAIDALGTPTPTTSMPAATVTVPGTDEATPEMTTQSSPTATGSSPTAPDASPTAPDASPTADDAQDTSPTPTP